jgi:predicted dehydrogenase
MEYPMRNWRFFVWLSGDVNVEQHVHALDVANWAMGDQHPVERLESARNDYLYVRPR